MNTLSRTNPWLLAAGGFAGGGVVAAVVLLNSAHTTQPEVAEAHPTKLTKQVPPPVKMPSEMTEAEKDVLRQQYVEYYNKTMAEREAAKYDVAMALLAAGNQTGGIAHMQRRSRKAGDVIPSEYKGYAFGGEYTVTGYIDPDGKRGDDFNGCEYGRVLILDYTRSVTCTSYNYAYAYHPRAILVENAGDLGLIIDGTGYSVRR